jgi:hypothetical protein
MHEKHRTETRQAAITLMQQSLWPVIAICSAFDGTCPGRACVRVSSSVCSLKIFRVSMLLSECGGYVQHLPDARRFRQAGQSALAHHREMQRTCETDASRAQALLSYGKRELVENHCLITYRPPSTLRSAQMIVQRTRLLTHFRAQAHSLCIWAISAPGSS